MKKRLLAVFSIVLIIALLFSSLAFYKNATAASTISVSISGGYLRGIPRETTFSAFKRSFTNPYNWNWYIYLPGATGKYDYLTTSYTSNIGTGFTFKIERSFNNIDSYDIVVLGDVNGDGEVNSADYLALKLHVKRVSGSTLTGAYFYAADLNNDGKVSATDYLRIKRFLAGVYDLDSVSYVTDPISTMTQGTNKEDPWYSGWY